MTPPAEKVVVFGCGMEELLGILHPAAAPDRGLGVLIIVGGPQYRVGSHRQFVQLARALAARGFPVLRFDYRGMGDSSGEFPGFEHIEPDVEAAVEALRRELPLLNRVVLFGLCDAASAALLACTNRHVAALVLANPWVRTVSGQAKSYVQHYYGRRLMQVGFWRKLVSGQLNVAAAMADFLRKLARAGWPGHAPRDRQPSFIDRMLSGLQTFRHPVLVLLSERDLTAEEFRALCRSDPRWRRALARPSVTMHSCAGADHTFSTEAAREEMTASTIEWLGRLTAPAAQLPMRPATARAS